MVIGLAACGGGGNTAPAPANNTSNAANTTDDKPLAGDYNIRVWAAEKAVALTKTQIENFNASNDMGIKFNVTIDPKSEADAGTDMITDIEAGPDIYFFVQD